MNKTRTFDEYVTGREIIRQVVALRMKEAARRSEAVFFRGISKSAPNPHRAIQSLPDLLPPRSCWTRPARAVRVRLGSSGARQAACLNDALRGLSGADPWAANLRALIQEVRAAMLDAGTRRFTTPDILCKAKDGDGIRAVAAYQGIADRVIIGVLSRYLRDLMDPVFLNCSYAFRKAAGTDHHAGVESLVSYAEARREYPLWVAECDLRKFFDSIHHDVALDALDRVNARISQKGPGLDPRARRLFVNLLESYTFPGTALPRIIDWSASRGNQAGQLWIADELKRFHAEPATERIGIPQGSAVSGVVANLVLHAADEAVLGESRDPDLFYARYCDDIIIIHPDKKRCGQALGRYMMALDSLKLVSHEPVEINACGAAYYRAKSKAPYAWGPDGEGRTRVPWIPWLGYHVQRNGELRVREASLEKELNKQARLVRRVEALVSGSPDGEMRSASTILERVSFRLVAMAVGRRTAGSGVVKHVASPCWGSGFRLLLSHKHIGSQLKRLDAGRERQKSILSRFLKRAANVRQDVRLVPADRRKPLAFLGAPFSYFGFFRKTSTLGSYFKSYGE
jgi:hypothetical protein